MNENGEFFVDFCVVDGMVIRGMLYLYKFCYKIIWVLLIVDIENFEDGDYFYKM